MAHALSLPGSNAALKTYPSLALSRGAYSYSVETSGDRTTYAVTDGVDTISVPITWGFGAGSQTWVLEYRDRLYESLVTFYPAIGGLDVTMGDQAIEPKTLEEAFGRLLGPGDSANCFNCHATNAVVENRLRLDSFTPGVRCARCHVGASLHLANISQGKLEAVPPQLKRLSSEQISNFCGQCHRTWETVVRDHLRGPVDVRFQPYRLALSKCFDGSDPRISCLACHDPHQEVVRDGASYDSKCLACHGHAVHALLTSGSPPGARPASLEIAKSCPVATSNCVSCHMPKLELPGSHQAFTDHDIRIVHANEPYPN